MLNAEVDRDKYLSNFDKDQIIMASWLFQSICDLASSY